MPSESLLVHAWVPFAWLGFALIAMLRLGIAIIPFEAIEADAFDYRKEGSARGQPP